MLQNLYPTSRARYLNSTKPVRVAAKETTGGYNIQTMSYIYFQFIQPRVPKQDLSLPYYWQPILPGKFFFENVSLNEEEWI